MSVIGSGSSAHPLEQVWGKLWIVLVGVNRYQDSRIPDLRFCGNDCKALAETFKISTQNFQETEIIALYEGGEKNPERSEVIASIQVFHLAKSEDTVLFYFSGHGYLDTNNRPVLCVSDTILEDLADTGIKLDDLLHELSQCEAQRQLVWLDACQEQQQDNETGKNPAGQLLEDLERQAEQSQDFYAMLSCNRAERSWEISELQHGLFTYYLIEGLGGKAANAEGKIDADSLFKYVERSIKKFIEYKKSLLDGYKGMGGALKEASTKSKFNWLPSNASQAPQRIARGSGELIIGLAKPVNQKKALIVDSLAFSEADISLCRVLQARGSFTVSYCFIQDKQSINVQQIIANYFQDEDNKSILLYLTGTIEFANPKKYELICNQNIRIDLTWLSRQLKDALAEEIIVIADILDTNGTSINLIDILQPSQDKSLCLITATNSIPNNRRFLNKLVTILESAGKSDKEFWVSELITELQKWYSTQPYLHFYLWLSGSAEVMEILSVKVQRSDDEIFEINVCPYKSLKAFTQDDAYFFHGREDLIAEIIEKLKATSFLAIVGASGSGKSSVVRAGVIPQLVKAGLFDAKLERDRSCQAWVMLPGSDPLVALATTLAPDNPEFLEGVLHLDIDFLVTWLHQQPKSISILVIDQFEELFTSKLSLDSLNYINLIVGTIKEAEDCFKVVITLRDDFLKNCLAMPNLASLVRQSTILVPSYLTEEEYRQILKKPAHKVGLTIEDGLINVLLQELQTESLPLLQFALEELWDKRTSGKLTLENYQKNIGGLEVILGRKAQETYQGLNKKQQQCAQMIFESLVLLGEGKEDTRRRIPITKLRVSKYKDVLETTLKALISARLLVVSFDINNEEQESKTTVEIAHEILIRKWKTLLLWLDTNRNQIRLIRDLEKKADEWKLTANSQKDDFLLSEAELIKYRELYVDVADKILAEVHKFVDQSIKKHNRLKKEDEVRQTREFENEINYLLKTSEALLLSNKELDALIIALWTGTKVQKSNLKINSKTKIHILGGLQNTFLETKEFNRLESHRDFINEVVFSPNGHIIATASSDRTVKLWNIQGQLLHTLKDHTDNVNGVIFSPDGRIIASASSDQTIKLWNIQGQLLHTLKDHIDDVNGVIFSPDGRIIASASSDQTVKLWNIQGRLLHTLKDSVDAKKVVFSPDGQTIAFTSKNPYSSDSGDHTVKLWNIQGQSNYVLVGHSNFVNAVAFSPDGQAIATASSDQTVRIWHTNGQVPYILRGHKNQVIDVVFSPDGETLASISKDETVMLWDRKGKLICTLTHINTVNDLAFNADSKTIATANWEGTVKVWNILGSLLHTFRGHTDEVNSVVFSPDGKTLASASNDKSVKLWNVRDEIIQTLKSCTNSVTNMTFSHDKQILVSTGYDIGSENEVVELWDKNWKLLHSFVARTRWVNVVAFSPDGQILASAGQDGIIYLLTRKGNLMQTIKTQTFDIKKVLFNPDGLTLVSTSLWSSRDLYHEKYYEIGVEEEAHKTVKVWDRKGKLLHTLCHQAQITSVIFSLDGQVTASASSDGIIKLWNQQGLLLQTLEGHTEQVTSLELSPDGKIIASASSDGTVKLWNLKGNLICSLADHTRGVNKAIFSPNGKTLASSSRDKTIKFWDLQGQLLYTLKGHTKSVEIIVFSPNSQILASSSDDYTIKLWNLQGELLHTFNDHLHREVKSLEFSSDGQTLASCGTTVKLWSLDLDYLMSRGCDWVRDYLTNNPNVSEEERKICKNIGI